MDFVILKFKILLYIINLYYFHIYYLSLIITIKINIDINIYIFLKALYDKYLSTYIAHLVLITFC